MVYSFIFLRILSKLCWFQCVFIFPVHRWINTTLGKSVLSQGDLKMTSVTANKIILKSWGFSCITIFSKYLRKWFHTFLYLTIFNSSLAHALLHITFFFLNNSWSFMILLIVVYFYLTTLSVLLFTNILFILLVKEFYCLILYYFDSNRGSFLLMRFSCPAFPIFLRHQLGDWRWAIESRYFEPHLLFLSRLHVINFQLCGVTTPRRLTHQNIRHQGGSGLCHISIKFKETYMDWGSINWDGKEKLQEVHWSVLVGD